MYNLPKNITLIIEKLREAGYEAFVVGGFVRDLIRDIEPHDADITTNALPQEVEAVFSDFKVIETGLKHGTVTVLYEGEPIEITTYRIEKGYSDMRHPDKIEFTTDITKDLSRRDFTMNSIAYSPYQGFVDPFGGKNDIEDGIIRCVGNSEERFREDALRILRALRFCSVTGYKIEENTEKALYSCKYLLPNLSKERIFAEISKMLCGKNIRYVLTKYIDIISIVLPEIKDMKGFEQHNFHHIYDVLNHTAVVVENAPNDVHMRFSALFHDCGKPDCFSLVDGVGHFYRHSTISAEKAKQALIRLKCDTATKEKVIKLVKIHDTPIECDERIIKKRLRSLGEELFFDLIKLQRCDNLAQAPEFFYRQKQFDEIEALTKEILKQNECFSLKHLAVNGNDLLALGLKGKKIGEVLDFLLDAVIEKRVDNDKLLLLQYYQNNM